MRTSAKALVLGAGGNVSQGIIKALRAANLPVKIIGACIGEYSKGLYMCDEGYICPYAADDRFIPWVADFCNQNEIDIIFTGVEENILALAKKEEYLKTNTKAVFVSSSYDQLLIGQDKYLTCEWLKRSGCNYPLFQLWSGAENAKRFAETVGYPIIAKPRNGKSSKGIVRVCSEEEIDKCGALDNYVLEQCVGDDKSEYTIGCYSDKHGRLQKLLPMRRKLYNGTTVWAKTVNDQRIVDECEKICRVFQPRGPLNVQLRLDKDGRPVCFELNVRFSGTTAIRSKFGFQDVKAMVLEYVFGQEDVSECFQLKSGEVFRFDEEFYLSDNTVELMRNEGMIREMQSHHFSTERDLR